jgi:hypothetical protein
VPELARKRNLRLVDPETGLITEEGCPHCKNWETTYLELERKQRGLLLQIGNLRADRDAKARAHGKWQTALSIFRYWQSLTGHSRAEFTPDRFWIVEPFLTRAEERGEDGAAKCRSAIRGLVASEYHMKRGQHRRRNGKVYDDFWRPFQAKKDGGPSQDTFEGFIDADPSRDADPTFAQMTMIDHAKEVAGRVLERARLIEAGTDLVAIAHLLVEVERLIREWMQLPEVPVKAAA